MATIRQVESGKFQAIVRKAGHPPMSATFATKKAAREWAAEREADVTTGRSHGPSHAHRLGELLKQYKAGPLLTLRAKADRERMLGIWFEALGDIRLSDITPTRISDALREYAATPITRKVRRERRLVTVERKRSSQTVRHLHMALSALLDFAQMDLHWLVENPARNTRRAEPAAPRIRWLSDEERERLLEACRQSENPDLHLVVMLALTSGARLSEITHLKWSQIDQKQRVAWLTPEGTKTAEPRAMPLVPEVLEALKARPRTLRVDLVFPSPKKRGQPRNMRQAWDVARKRAQLPDFRFHDLRHSAATELLRAGVDSRVVAAVLGHKTLAMVKRYAHVTPALVVEAAERAARKSS